VLYTVWILPEIVAFRNSALVIGALAGLYPIYQCRSLLLQKIATPLWLMVALFLWAIFHLLFLSSDNALQALEFKRIWKYAAIGAIFSLGLGISFGNESANFKTGGDKYWLVFYAGLCMPVLIYLLKYVLTSYEANFDIKIEPYLKIYFESQKYYIPKSDYVAFCIPLVGISLAQIFRILMIRNSASLSSYVSIFGYVVMVCGALFLFSIQNIKNGIAYSIILFGFFIPFFILKNNYIVPWKKAALLAVFAILFASNLYIYIQKNDTWRMLVADTKIAFQLEKHQEWKYSGGIGYPTNEYGESVSGTTYDRAAWFKVGLKLAFENPFGYGLIEDSFQRLAKKKWPEVSSNLSHSHSGWLDIALGFGLPAIMLIFTAIFYLIHRAKSMNEPWRQVIFWGSISNLLIWCTTELAATVTFVALIFWICFCAGLILFTTKSQDKCVDCR